MAYREYDLPENIILFDYDTDPMSYLYFHLEDKSTWQIKLESPHEIVLDHFDEEGELIDEIGCWDFYD